MAPKQISTSTYTSVCDVCGRTLLSGERPEVYVAGGDRRLVCELCVGRAMHEGWVREGAMRATHERTRERSGGRSLLGRLARARWTAPAEEHHPADEGDAARPARRRAGAAVGAAENPGPVAATVAAPTAPPIRHVDDKLMLALEAFNGSDCPRRVAGVARSLGGPVVTLRVHSPGSSIVGIVVAWELSWYRYTVDTAGEPASVVLVDQGTHLEELDDRDRLGGFTVDERGELMPA
ncbi:MAG TPA: hypothetical protein VHX88_01700 [Solirubrobacteraceae bacterium]|jgi:hypothetical protein|nr:hypothetical protein [Solirubrobacteraceae bacterium]